MFPVFVFWLRAFGRGACLYVGMGPHDDLKLFSLLIGITAVNLIQIISSVCEWLLIVTMILKPSAEWKGVEVSSCCMARKKCTEL